MHTLANFFRDFMLLCQHLTDYGFYCSNVGVAVVLCMYVCVCLSHVSIVLKQLHGSSCVFANTFSSTYPTLCFREIRIPSKIGKGTSLDNLVSDSYDLENLATLCPPLPNVI